jgi:DNA repair photolyase
MLNLEELAEEVRKFGETVPWQQLYKFDNMTDTVCLEPEYGASEVMVGMFATWPGRYLLLYTKSDNVEHLLNLDHRGHTLISWTVSCETVASRIEKRTLSLENRIAAIERSQKAGYTVRVRLSPLCPVKDWHEETRDLIRRLLSRVTPDVISLDVLGWMDIAQMREAMDLSLFDEAYVLALDRLESEEFRRNGKHVWPHEMRREILRCVIEEIRRFRPGQPVSICMETTQMWQDLGPLMGMTPEDYVCCCGPTSVPGHERMAAVARRAPVAQSKGQRP